jgi:beta-mannanase
VPVPSVGAYLGVLSYTHGRDNLASVAYREAQLSRTLAIDSHYYDWLDNFPSSDESADIAAGRIPMITWWGTRYTKINDGSYDARITRAARAVKRFGQPVFIRWAAEMNGDWFAWSGAQNHRDPCGYVAAYRRIHDIFASEGVRNVSWVWAPNSDSSPGGIKHSSWNNWRNYYPGDAYVDWVGIDGYNWGSLLQGSRPETFARIMSPVYSDYAARKPIMIAETSSTEAGVDKGRWILDMADWVKAHSAIKAVVWFDRTTKYDWAIDTSAGSTAAFAAVAADPYFGVLRVNAAGP